MLFIKAVSKGSDPQRRRYVAIVALLLLATSLGAAQPSLQPEDGWYFNPQEPGYGLNLELQGGTLLVALFIYRADGSAVWYNAFGPFDAAAGQFSGDLVAFSGGPCLTCGYTLANPQAKRPGTISLSVRDPAHIEVTVEGRQFGASRFTLGDANGLNRLLGEWLLVATTPNDGYQGDRVSLLGLQRQPDLNQEAALGLLTDFPQTLAIGFDREVSFQGEAALSLEGRPFSLLVVLNENRFRKYTFDFTGFNAMAGEVREVDGLDTPLTAPIPFVGARLQEGAPRP